jgi:hypothetical protein
MSEFEEGNFSAPNLPKEASRLYNLVEVRRSFVTNASGALKGSWMELCGRGAPTLELLLREKALSENSFFVGVDSKEENIRHNREVFARTSAAVWAYGDLRRLLNTGLAEDGPVLGCTNTVVVNYDTCGNAQGEDWRKDLRDLRLFVDRKINETGQMVVIVNAGINRGPNVETFCHDLSTFLGAQVLPESVVIYRGETFEGGVLRRHTSRANVVLHLSPTRGGSCQDSINQVEAVTGFRLALAKIPDNQ